MKLFFPKNHYNSNYRSHVFPLLKPFFKNNEFTNEERINLYGVSEKEYDFVQEIKNASIVVLPMSWDYYLLTKQLHKAKDLIDKAVKYNKKVLVVTVGDYGVIVPEFKNVLVLRTSGDSINLNKNNKGIPVFINDPLKRIYNTKDVDGNYSKQPIIGFCGQTNASVTNALKESLKVGFRNLKHFIGLSTHAPQKIQSTSYNRSRVLSIVKKTVRLKANFIERKKYRAGVITNEERKKTELAFYENMRNSNYVICIRGAGNFSVRLYETLAMGRIPVFINTNCLLPLFDDIDWKKHVVWIESYETSKIEERILEFHSNLSENEFKQLQFSNRKLWEDKLTLGGFFKSFLNTIEQ